MKPVIFGSPKWYGSLPTRLSRVIGDHRVIANGGAVLGSMPPYSVSLLPVVPMNGLTDSTLDAAEAARAAAADGLAAASGGMSTASSARRSTVARARGAGRTALGSDPNAPDVPGLTMTGMELSRGWRGGLRGGG
ncbi:hypothetical protein GCM10010430_12970 [Kitasatospora cystarginea]|uniref:Uncharacterized protein n=1 Tax=Kitasatospora cystarginea TaxID=58350 RepID=A0ABP5QEP1_9ACTN